jgi:FAD/FMN-containing dehydrogenase
MGGMAAPRELLAPQALLADLPALDGSLAYSDAALDLMARDQGGMIRRRPRAILHPGSIDDVVRIVQYANRQRLPVVMRGRAHSRYGQSLTDGGIVIDSRSLANVRGISNGTIDIEAGASLATLVSEAFAAGFALPVMTDCTMLSVGGFLSVGGQAAGSQRFGSFVDQAAELDVVTGDGRLVTCSETRERELFEMTLAGQGQCALIVRARLRLVPAPAHVTLRTLSYDAVEPFLADQERFVSDNRLHVLSGGIGRNGEAWEYRTSIGLFGAAGEDSDPLAVAGSSRARVSEPVQRQYPAYFLGDASRSRVVPGEPAGTSAPAARAARPSRTLVASPSLAVWLPAKAAGPLLADLLSSREHTDGIIFIECTGHATAPFRRPLFRVPAEERMFAVWLLRSAYAESGSPLDAQLAANAAFLNRAIAAGAKRYPPYGGVVTPADWRVHYGDALYRRLADAKRTYDARAVLTPGPNIFPVTP